MISFKQLFEGDVVDVNFARGSVQRPNSTHGAHSAVSNEDGSYSVLGSAPHPRELQHHRDADTYLMRNPSGKYVAFHKAEGKDHVTGSELIGDVKEHDVDKSRVRF